MSCSGFLLSLFGSIFCTHSCCQIRLLQTTMANTFVLPSSVMTSGSGHFSAVEEWICLVHFLFILLIKKTYADPGLMACLTPLILRFWGGRSLPFTQICLVLDEVYGLTNLCSKFGWACSLLHLCYSPHQKFGSKSKVLEGWPHWKLSDAQVSCSLEHEILRCKFVRPKNIIRNPIYLNLEL